jgi:hypothetical protein
MYSLALIIFVVSEKKACEHFPKGSNVNLFPAVVAILEFWSALEKLNFEEDLPMIIPGQFGLYCPCSFREEAFGDTFPIGSNVKLSPTVAAIFHFISEQKTKFVENHPMNIPV